MTLVVAACLVVGAAACGDDGDGGFLGATDGNGTEGGGTTGDNGSGDNGSGENGSDGGGIPGPSGGGYSDSMRADFMNECTGTGAAQDAEDLCGCMWEYVTHNVPVEQYQDFEQSYEQDPNNAPDWVMDAGAACSDHMEIPDVGEIPTPGEGTYGVAG